MVGRDVTALLAGIGLAMFAAQHASASESMAVGENGYSVSEPLLTIGETLYYTSGSLGATGILKDNTVGAFTPVGILDGIGATELDRKTVRVFVNHELLHFRGNEYEVSNGAGGTFSMTGARISYFDIDKVSKDIKDGGIAYSTIYDANGDVASDLSFLANDLSGFSRLCSSQMVEAGQFENGKPWWWKRRWHGKWHDWRWRHRRFMRGLEDTIYFSNEEDGGGFNPVGGAYWALDVETGGIWHVPDFGRGAWEGSAELDTGTRRKVAFLLMDDSSPFDVDSDNVNEAAPLYLYVGRKRANGDFLERNGLRDGRLYVWVSDTGETSPAQFNGAGTLHGTWVEIDNSPTGAPSEDGSTGFDEFGYPTQRTLWARAEALGAFGFSRPEDVSTNPHNGREAVLASTGVDTFENGVDTFGTIYTVTTNFRNMKASLTILYDGDADPQRRLRSPDNLDWADDGRIFVQEDEAEETTLSGEPLFGPGAVNPNEAGIVRINPLNGNLRRVANVDRSVVLDASIPVQTDAVDRDAGNAGEWETSGIVDVSDLFDEKGGQLFLFDVQAHGIDDQETINADSRISDFDLAEGGQLLFLIKNSLYRNK